MSERVQSTVGFNCTFNNPAVHYRYPRLIRELGSALPSAQADGDQFANNGMHDHFDVMMTLMADSNTERFMPPRSPRRHPDRLPGRATESALSTTGKKQHTTILMWPAGAGWCVSRVTTICGSPLLCRLSFKASSVWFFPPGIRLNRLIQSSS